MMNDGTRLVRGALEHAREMALDARRFGFPLGPFSAGLATGQIITAEVFLDADKLAAQGALNEIRFLSREPS